MCGCQCCIFAKIVHSSLLTWHNLRLKHLKDRSHNAQYRRSGEISSHIFETYKNSVRPHDCNIYNTAADMDMEIFFPCNSKHRGLPKWKCVLRCFDKGPSIFLPSQEVIKDTTNTCPTLRSHVYCNFSRCTEHGQRLYHKLITCPLCSTVASYYRPAKVYTRKELLLL